MTGQLIGRTREQLSTLFDGMGMPDYTASQVCKWLYQKGIRSVDDMTDISKKHRETLSRAYEVGFTDPISCTVSGDGTKKYLFATRGGSFIETAWIPDGERATLCVSCQSGCRMGCKFCMTAKQGFQHDLTAGEIINQVMAIPERERLTNIVFMGMGEPLDNYDNVMDAITILTSPWGMGWSPRRITLSTIGVIPNLKKILDQSNINIAVSLHNPFPDERMQIIPAEKKYPIRDVVELLRSHDFSGQRKLSFEYTVIAGVNDTRKHVKGLSSLLNGLNCHINLIRYHKVPVVELTAAQDQAVNSFRNDLASKGFLTTIRTSRGEDIGAACGLLSTRKLLETTSKE